MNRAQPLTGKCALVTGGAKRVGRAIAIALGRAGARVAVHYRTSEDEALATCEAIEAEGGKAFPIAADLAVRDATRRLVDETAERMGCLDILVPSAAGYERTPLPTVTEAQWDAMLELNVTSPFVLAQRAAPLLRATHGSIVFVTCASATTPYRDHLPYVVSKGALRQLMRTLALELSPEVRVNAVAPGTVLAPDDMSAAEVERIRRRIPLGHLGSPEDVASAVVYLAASPFVTGHEVLVDGGRGVAAIERFS